MKKIKLLIELSYDAELWYSGNKDKEGKDWFFKDVLGSKIKNDLVLHSNEIDTIGTVKIIKYVK